MSTGEYEMRDEDRLPWLETVEDDYDDGPSVVRVVLLVLLALAIVAAAIFGYQYFKKHQGVDGNGALITAQDGDYKVKPDDPGGMKVEGEGDTAIATSDGAGMSNAAIDMKAAPEAPVAGKKVAPAKVDVGASKVIAAIPSAAAAASGGALVQLGSFGSESEANATWATISKKFAYLAPMGKSVQAAQVNGQTVYRLRVNAGGAGAATSLCAKLAAAGQACFVPRS
ncbi:SPOR domain-containing protein [Sphingomonas sp. HMP6]|uniref:SPOR domain-containing protein n=1 Tax=Sphingomonas sp. HMP6 TaxID=1517551 RepID=UPI00159645D6|nr:SPOR domain-containing protein [Sphingomonas sp. HMP6]BCA57315.1 sporulation protein [Sphingomonas sp. HMP6]